MIDRLARIAPLTVLDVSTSAMEAASSRSVDGAAAGGFPIAWRVGDGTSAIVLSDLRGEAHSAAALVVAPGDDRSALESCRLGLEAKYTPVIAIVGDRDAAVRCEALGARALVRAEIVGQLVEQSLQQAGLGISAAVGVKRGESLEFRVLPSSPAIGVSLAHLRADGWRVAAIYRGDELVLPTGRRPSPRTTASCSSAIRSSCRTWPRASGWGCPRSRCCTARTCSRTRPTAATPRWRPRRSSSGAHGRPGSSALTRSQATATATGTFIETELPDGSTVRKQSESAKLEGASIERALPVLRSKKPGVIVAKKRGRTLFEVLFGVAGHDATLCNELNVPVLFAKGASRYERVVLCLTDGEGDLSIAEVALDLARMFDAPFRIHHVRLPTYLQSADKETDKLVETIERRARLHGLQPEIEITEGNPIAQWHAALRKEDLAVVGRDRGARDSFSRPDLALRLAWRARGSTLVITVDA